MNEQQAHKILQDLMQSDRLSDVLRGHQPHILLLGTRYTELEGEYRADELEAIAWWMREHSEIVQAMEQEEQP